MRADVAAAEEAVAVGEREALDRGEARRASRGGTW